eukprot:SAG31_NODE_4_length_45662_cov_15.654622_23_plen_65_part_00
MAVIQHAISDGLNSQISASSAVESNDASVLDRLRQKAGNCVCADCGVVRPFVSSFSFGFPSGPY